MGIGKKIRKLWLTNPLVIQRLGTCFWIAVDVIMVLVAC